VIRCALSRAVPTEHVIIRHWKPGDDKPGDPTGSLLNRADLTPYFEVNFLSVPGFSNATIVRCWTDISLYCFSQLRLCSQ
jgi:hypothetical protein